MYTSSDTNTPEAVHPRPRPEYPGALRADALRALFADCADFQQREVLFGLDEKRRLLIWAAGLAVIALSLVLAPDAQSLERWSRALIPALNLLFSLVLLPSVYIVAKLRAKKKPAEE